jgi:sugar phosphate isomerase/epimerase
MNLPRKPGEAISACAGELLAYCCAMDRRVFIETVTAAAAGAMSFPGVARTADRLDRIGLELYSVRNAMRSDPEGTLAAVRAIGYTDVELLWSHNNFDRTPQQVRATLDHEGLRAPSAHIAPEILLKDWDKSLDTAHFLGHQYLIVPSLTPDTQSSLEAWRIWADRFNTAGAAARTAGLWLAFHNEPDHMKVIEGKVAYDFFVSRLDASVVRLQLDVGNMVMGGGDPRVYLERYPTRYGSFHLKDVVADRTHDIELGAGTFDLKRFLAAVPAIQTKPCYVEQEGPTNELASARANWNYINSLTF